MIQKMVKKTLRCGTTGEYTTTYQMVTILSETDKLVAAARAVNDARFDAEAEREGRATNRHRQVRPDVQKIGWKG